MLIAGIDRNRVTEPDRHIERVLSINSVTQVYQSEEYSEFRKQFQKRKGIILRKGDKRNRERRKEAAFSQSTDQDRRQGSASRRSSDRWNSETHELVLIALEKNPTSPSEWQEGDEILVDQGPHRDGLRVEHKPETEDSSTPPASPNREFEQDYVLHLSTRK